MAISKIKPIKSTLKKALDYILNPMKNGDGQYVEAFGCSPATADLELQLTTAKARNKSERVAYHLIQSFSPEDNITPEKALEIGKEYAERITEGKYEFVVATHIDKGHMHNHIIFNSTSFVDYKKFHMPVWFKYRMFNINDRLCKENGLSVIDNASERKGKSWYEEKVSKEGKSWKDKMQAAIDVAIVEAKDYDDFIHIMQMEGYEYGETEKTLKFRATFDGQEKFTRVNARNFGEFYSKEMIVKRILEKDFDKNLDKSKVHAENNENIKDKKIQRENGVKKQYSNPDRINLIIDISKNIKAQKSRGYEHALVMNNINSMVKTVNYLQEKGLTDTEKLVANINELYSITSSLKEEYKQMETFRKALSEKIKYSQNYVKFKKTAVQVKKESSGSQFLKEHENDIKMFQVAKIYLEKNNVNTSYIDIKGMIQEHKEMIANEKIMKMKITEFEKKLHEMDVVKSNVEKILGIHILTDKEKQINTKSARNAFREERE